MKKLAFLVSLLFVAGAASARAESIVYDNSTASSFTSAGLPLGPQSGNADFNNSDDNSFTITSSATIDQIMVGIWVSNPDTLSSLTGGIYTAPFGGGTELLSFSGAPTSSTLVTNSFDLGAYSLYEEYYSVTSLNLTPNTYYLALLTGSATGAAPQLYWDQSYNANTSADEWDSYLGVIQTGDDLSGQASTTFQLFGTGNGADAAPEPSSVFLLGSGLACLIGMIRRRAKA
jgi:hypothetical protein